ncbi:hypothetical protein NEOKW01_1486 [Nematocida sp. AWRm80]|nr:hypothetical protein NEOKW01_1486 [Nematocida sp. AWRm80]
MKKSTKRYPEKKITITIIEPDDLAFSEAPEMKKQVAEIIDKILSENKPGEYFISALTPIPTVSHSFPIGDKDPTNPQGMLFPPEYFQKEDPDHPFKKQDPDDDHLPPQGPNDKYFI